MTVSATPAVLGNAIPGTLRYPVTPGVTHVMEVSLRGCDELLITAEQEQKSTKSAATDVPLCIKLGPGSTAPSIHISHMVVLNEMRQLQGLGHQIIFLIGDLMSTIGDPPGRNAMHPPLTREQIEASTQTYHHQTSMVLDPSKTEIRYNSKWCDPLDARDIIQLAAKYTVVRIMEYNDFTKHYKADVSASVHEFPYPLMQGYDSIALKSDLELDDVNRKFNLLVGHELQRGYGQESQCIPTTPLLMGLDGVKKMSKPKSNYVGISEAPDEMFGKLMSISDDLMWAYYILLSSRLLAKIDLMKQKIALGHNPHDCKVMLAQEIVAHFHSQADTKRALEDLGHRARGGVPNDTPRIELSGAPLGIAQLLKQVGLYPSTSDTDRNVEQGGVKINGTVISDKGLKVDVDTFVMQIDRCCFVRVVLR